MKYRCKHCLWFDAFSRRGGECCAPVPQWVPLDCRVKRYVNGDGYANYCPMFRPRAEIEEMSEDVEVQCVPEADHE